MVAFECLEKILRKFRKFRIVRCRQRQQSHLIVAGILFKLSSLLAKNLYRLFSYRAIDESCLAETAAADTAAEDLKVGSVMNDTQIRYDRRRRICACIKVLDDALFNRGLYAVFNGTDVGAERLIRSFVVVIGDLVKRRHVDAFDLIAVTKKLLSGHRVIRVFRELVFADLFRKLEDHFLALAHHGDIEKVRHRLDVIRDRAAAADDRIVLATVLLKERDLTEIHHLKDVGETHLVAERKAQDIKVAKRCLCLLRIQRDVLFAKDLIHVEPRRKGSFARDKITFVQHVVKDLKREVAHADLIDIGKAESESDVRCFARLFEFVEHVFLDDGIELTADISGGAFDRHQVRFRKRYRIDLHDAKKGSLDFCSSFYSKKTSPESS